LTNKAKDTSMEDNEIYMLFSSLTENAALDDEPLKEVLKTLVSTTLKYRDTILKGTGVIVTVEDVRAALEWLVPAIRTGRLPVTDNRVRLDLLNLWLDELRINSTRPH
jgi:hypothetical protein